MSKELTKSDLELLAKKCQECCKKAINKRNTLVSGRDDQMIDELDDKIDELLKISNQINGLSIVQTFTDLEDAKTKIQQSTDKAIAAVNRLNGVKNIIQAVASFVDFAAQIVSVIQNPVSATAKVADLVDILNERLDSL